jgi:hypothetical protein
MNVDSNYVGEYGSVTFKFENGVSKNGATSIEVIDNNVQV